MRNFIFFYLEPICFYLSSGFLFYFSYRINAHFKYKVLAVFYLIGAILMTLAIRSYPAHNNVYYYNILYAIAVTAIGAYYFSTFSSSLKKKFSLGTIGIVVIYYFYRNVLGAEVFFDSMGYVISSTGIVILIFMYVHQTMNNVTEESLSLNFDFWFACAQLLYYAGSFVVFLTYNYLTERIIATYSKPERDLLTYLWAIPIVLLSLSTFTTCTGVLWISSRKKS